MSNVIPMTLFDEGMRLRDEALARVNKAAFSQAVIDVIDYYVVPGARFTTDDVWEHLEREHVEPPKEPRAMGSAILAAQRRKLCTPTSEFIPTRRKQAHRSPQRVWVRTGRG